MRMLWRGPERKSGVSYTCMSEGAAWIGCSFSCRVTVRPLTFQTGPPVVVPSPQFYMDVQLCFFKKHINLYIFATKNWIWNQFIAFTIAFKIGFLIAFSSALAIASSSNSPYLVSLGKDPSSLLSKSQSTCKSNFKSKSKRNLQFEPQLKNNLKVNKKHFQLLFKLLLQLLLDLLLKLPPPPIPLLSEHG